MRARYDLTGRYVLHTGALVRRKNLPFLVRAFSRYVEEAEDRETLLALHRAGRAGDAGRREL